MTKTRCIFFYWVLQYMYTFWYLYNHTQHICLTILYKQYICTLLIQQIYITRTLHITKQLSRRTYAYWIYKHFMYKHACTNLPKCKFHLFNPCNANHISLGICLVLYFSFTPSHDEQRRLQPFSSYPFLHRVHQLCLWVPRISLYYSPQHPQNLRTLLRTRLQ